jgi:hypothetical protein
MAQVSACDECGYRPRADDCHEVVVESRVGSTVEDVTVLHVICYGCGREWVE